MGHWSNASGIPSGPKLGIPLQLYSASLRSVVLGPGGNWMTAMNTGSDQSLGCGIKDSVYALPPGFVHDTFLVGGTGINATVSAYGEALLTLSGKPRPDPNDDFVLSHLGYWTDNGAYYDSRNVNNSGFANHEVALKALKQRWTAEGIPFRYVQWDDWQWRNGSGAGMDVPGIVHWPPDESAIPDGLTDWLEMPTSLYAPMYAAQNDYSDQYTWLVDDVYGSSIPLDVQFYRDLFANGSKAQMKMFEQDFLCYYDWNTNLTGGDVSSGMKWLQSMNTAAEEADITLQLCMMTPVHVLASSQLSRVTNGRGTSDNSHNGAADLYPMGTSGLLLGALGLGNSRDNVWTSTFEHNCVGSNPNCTSVDYRIQNIAAMLGGGPYGPSDGIDAFNVPMIMASCRSDGVRLLADWPMGTNDAAFRQGFSSQGAHHVWTTHTTVSGWRWGLVLSVNVPEPVPMTLADVAATPNTDYLLLDMMATDSMTNASRPPKPVGVPHKDSGGHFVVPVSPPTVNGTDSDAGNYHVLAPVLSNGWCLLGEAAKVVTASQRRFTSVRVVPAVNDQQQPHHAATDNVVVPAISGMTATLNAASEERVVVWVMPPAATRAVLQAAAVSPRPLSQTPLGATNNNDGVSVAASGVVTVVCSARSCTGVDCDVPMTLLCSGASCECK
eukprot:m.130016 g.130016  ORF g.130016 m.130016 type:complete len:666 (+) comp11274_c1_seq2:922-2919(+)